MSSNMNPHLIPGVNYGVPEIPAPLVAPVVLI
jgi:hypothetical protein